MRFSVRYGLVGRWLRHCLSKPLFEYSLAVPESDTAGQQHLLEVRRRTMMTSSQPLFDAGRSRLDRIADHEQSAPADNVKILPRPTQLEEWG